MLKICGVKPLGGFITLDLKAEGDPTIKLLNAIKVISETKKGTVIKKLN